MPSGRGRGRSRGDKRSRSSPELPADTFEDESVMRFSYAESDIRPSSYLNENEAASRNALVAGPLAAELAIRPDDTAPRFPKVIWNVSPNIKLKLRKRFYPLAVTRLTLGIDYDLKTRDVAFKWSWQDRIIGGYLQVDRDEVSLSKRFDIDHRTHLDLRAAYDFHMRKTLFSIRVKPFYGVVANERSTGLTVKQRIPLDKRIAVEVHGRVQLPEAKFSNDTATTSVSLGEGDFKVDIDQLNFRFMLQ